MQEVQAEANVLIFATWSLLSVSVPSICLRVGTDRQYFYAPPVFGSQKYACVRAQQDQPSWNEI